jgi:GAF domain-containing protein
VGDVAAVLVEITAGLVRGPDDDTVLRLVSGSGARLLGAAATGVMLVDPRGGVDVVAASDEPARFVELLQTQTDQGPCLQCIADDAIVTSADLADDRERWPEFVQGALAVGFRSVVAVPMRLDGRAVGGLNLLYAERTVLPDWQLHVAQVLSDLVVLGLSQERGDRRGDRLAERTLTVLNDRVRLDHAVGLVAGSLEIKPEAALLALTRHATASGRSLRDIVRAVTDGDLSPRRLTGDDSAR